MKLSKLALTLLLIAALLVGAGGTYVGMTSITNSSATDQSQEHSQPQKQSKKKTDHEYQGGHFDKVKEAYQYISQHYYKDVSGDKLLNGAIQGMVESLGDRFSMYMDPKTAKQFTQSLSSTYEGIGTEVSMVNGRVTIMAPFKGSPAEKAGLRANDQIISINGKNIEGMNLTKAVQKIRGKKGTTVKLGVKRKGDSNLMKIDVKRGSIPIQTVHQDSVKKDGHRFGIIEINSFSEGTAKEFDKALKSLEDKGMDGLVIDVRGNPGGYLGSVTKIADMIIPNKKPIVQTEDRAGNKQPFFSKLKSKKDYPIVGLIDGGSASAAEILSAALQEAGGYSLVGEKSFGKGTVQQEEKFKDNSRIKLTVMKWLTPDSHWIHKKGIKPDVKVKQPDYFYAHPIDVEKKKPLIYNQNNEKIKNAQVLLEGLGFETGRDDGYFGKQTRTAVEAFQKVNQLPVTGKIDTKTASTLDQKILKAVDKKKNDLQLQTAFSVLEKD